MGYAPYSWVALMGGCHRLQSAFLKYLPGSLFHSPSAWPMTKPFISTLESHRPQDPSCCLILASLKGCTLPTELIYPNLQPESLPSVDHCGSLPHRGASVSSEGTSITRRLFVCQLGAAQKALLSELGSGSPPGGCRVGPSGKEAACPCEPLHLSFSSGRCSWIDRFHFYCEIFLCALFLIRLSVWRYTEHYG